MSLDAEQLARRFRRVWSGLTAPPSPAPANAEYVRLSDPAVTGQVGGLESNTRSVTTPPPPVAGSPAKRSPQRRRQRPADTPGPGLPPRHPWLHGGGLSAMSRTLVPDHYGPEAGRPEPLSWSAETAPSRAGLNPWRAVPREPPATSLGQEIRERIRAIWTGLP